jgi:hypothetical protein
MTFVRRGFLSRRTMICATIAFVEAARIGGGDDSRIHGCA